jgi:hypothetical protein
VGVVTVADTAETRQVASDPFEKLDSRAEPTLLADFYCQRAILMTDSTTRSLPWLRIIIEGVVIVVSILLAFGIDAWWEGQQNRAEEERVLSALLDEFVDNGDGLATTREVHRREVRAMEALLAAAESGALPATATLDTIFARALYVGHYNPRTGALSSTISSGRIDLVKNPELRNRLAGWDAIISDLVLDEQTRRDFVYHELIPALAGFGIGGNASNGRPSRSDYEEALGSRELLAYLRQQAGWVTHFLTHFDDVQAAADEIVADLANEIGSG